MHICEQLVHALEYLESQDISEEHLSCLHHYSLNGGKVTYKNAYEYFSENKTLQDNNWRFAQRVIRVSDGLKNRKGRYGA
jgi:hypothetical protein